MERKQTRPLEIGLGIRNVVFLLSLSSISTMATHKWVFNLAFEYIIKSELTFIALVLLIARREGLRLPTLISILTEFLLQFLKYDQFYSLKIIAGTSSDKIYMVTIFALIFLQFLAMYLCPVFYPISTTGNFQVGYTIKQLDDIVFAIFYPTSDEFNAKSDLAYFPDVNKYMDTLAYLTYNYPREFKVDYVPAFLLKQSLGSLMKGQKMGVVANAKLAQLDHKYPFMIYSHGFNSHMNLQATLCRDLASKGVIVIVPQHRDEDFIAKIQQHPVPLNRFIEVMNESVIKRKNDIQKLITCVLDSSKKVMSFFPNGEDLKQNFVAREQVIMCGHSYGGLTSMVTSLEDPRIYSTIVLDPAMNIFDSDPHYFKLLTQPQKKPFLILCSENFYKRFPHFSQREHIQNFINAQKNNKHSILAGELKEFGHGSFVDMAYFIPQELAQLRQDILSVSQVSTHHLMLNKCVEYFLYESQTKNDDLKKVNLQQVVTLFDDLCKNILEIKKDVFSQF